MSSSSDKTMLTYEQLKQTGDLASANATEEDKIKAMMYQSTFMYHECYAQLNVQRGQNNTNNNKYTWRRNDTTRQPSKTPSTYQQQSMTPEMPPQGYFCHICGSPEHFIRQCPKKGDPSYQKVKRGHGIPKTFMTKLDRGNLLGAMMTADGSFAIPTINAEAYTGIAEAKEEKQSEPEIIKPRELPDFLKCPICNDAFERPVRSPCCRKTFCYRCFSDSLIFKSENQECPVCHQNNVPLVNHERDLKSQQLVEDFKNGKDVKQVSNEDQSCDLKNESSTVENADDSENDSTDCEDELEQQQAKSTQQAESYIPTPKSQPQQDQPDQLKSQQYSQQQNTQHQYPQQQYYQQQYPPQQYYQQQFYQQQYPQQYNQKQHYYPQQQYPQQQYPQQQYPQQYPQQQYPQQQYPQQQYPQQDKSQQQQQYKAASGMDTDRNRKRNRSPSSQSSRRHETPCYKRYRGTSQERRQPERRARSPPRKSRHDRWARSPVRQSKPHDRSIRSPYQYQSRYYKEKPRSQNNHQ